MCKILITGFAGSIGEELTRQLAPRNKIFGLDIDETRMFDLIEELKIDGRVGDVRDKETVGEVFEAFKPDMVFHCAALKHVTPNESYPMEAVKTNIFGTYNVAYFCQKFGAKLVNISTDKVVNADSIMGITKKLAERIVKNMGFNSVRFGNVLGSRGSVLPIWQKQVNEGKPLTITDMRMERYMMTIPQAVELVIEASKMPQDGRIVILDMGKPIRILPIAEAIIEQTGGSIKAIGIRPGEVLTERLMTEEEEKRVRKINKFYIL